MWDPIVSKVFGNEVTRKVFEDHLSTGGYSFLSTYLFPVLRLFVFTILIHEVFSLAVITANSLCYHGAREASFSILIRQRTDRLCDSGSIFWRYRWHLHIRPYFILNVITLIYLLFYHQDFLEEQVVSPLDRRIAGSPRGVCISLKWDLAKPLTLVILTNTHLGLFDIVILWTEASAR
jgi:hypothetical protein